jgi:hypothetical protein
LVVAIAAAITVAISSAAPHESRHASRRIALLHADHPSYDGLNNLVGSADAVFIGTVTGTAPGTPIPAAQNPTGSTQGDIPQTDISVRVDTPEKGSLSSGHGVTVTVTGGASGSGETELEGVPPIDVGHQYVFFVVAGDGGKYYPLAGGAAIATKNTDGSFSLSGDVTGSGSLGFTTAQLSSVPPADHITVTLLSAPRQQVDGNVQDGSVSVARSSGVPTGIMGTVLVAGHELALDIAISNKRATGTFTIDGQAYTLRSPSVVPSASGPGIRINGKATAPGGSTQEVHIEVQDY